MVKDTLFYKKHTIRCKSKLLSLDSPIVMGILNITPDSFFDGGNYSTKEQILKRVGNLIDEGSAIIDIGAYSSRPGAEKISEKLEIQRLSLGLEIIREHYTNSVISVDTFRANVASWAIENFKVDIINDISAGTFEPEIIDVVANANVPFVAMHMQGSPESMQKNPRYKNVVQELLDYFAHHINMLRSMGINDLIIDPGFGFGKTIDHNYQLLASLDIFQMLKVPIMVGLSRKSMIQKLLNVTVDEALTGTIALHMVALQKGASILRVHDVKEAMQTISIYKKLLEESEKSLNLLQEI